MFYVGQFPREEFRHSLQCAKPVKTLKGLFNYIGLQGYFRLNLICPDGSVFHGSRSGEIGVKLFQHGICCCRT
jgi:hypothetical protein